MNICHINNPKHCFCQVPEEKLRKWAVERYRNNIPTMELLKKADNDEEREIISIVCLLDVDDETLLEMMGDVDLPEHHILHCREEVKKMVERMLRE